LRWRGPARKVIGLSQNLAKDEERTDRAKGCGPPYGPAQQERQSMRIVRSLLTAAVAILGISTSGAYAATEIQWWHAMSGQLGEKASEIAANFNAQNQD
jgi:hypothetical protein